MVNSISIISIFAFILAIIAIFITIILYFIPKPIIDDTNAGSNTTYSSNKINSSISTPTLKLQDEIDTLKTENTDLKNEINKLKTYVGILPSDNNSNTIVGFFNNKIGNIGDSNSVVDYINKEILNNQDFIDKIVINPNFNENISYTNIRNFFNPDVNKEDNRIKLINVDEVNISKSLKPATNPSNKSGADIQATILLPVSNDKYTSNDNGFWTWFADTNCNTRNRVGFNTGLWGRFNWNPEKYDIPNSSIGTIKESIADFTFSTFKLDDISKGSVGRFEYPGNPSRHPSEDDEGQEFLEYLYGRKSYLSVRSQQQFIGKDNKVYYFSTNDPSNPFNNNISPGKADVAGYCEIELARKDRGNLNC